MLSTESDSHSDGKLDVSDVPSDQDNKPSSFKHPGARGSGTQPPCEPTLLCVSESDDASPVKRSIKHPQARASDKGPSCEPTLLYGSESDDGSPIKRPKQPEERVSDKGPSCEPTLPYGSESDDGAPKRKPRQPSAPTLLYESDYEEGTIVAPKESDAIRDGRNHAADDQTLLYTEVSEGKLTTVPAVSSRDVRGGSPEESEEEQQDDKVEATIAVKDSDATLPYAEAELSSTDDEGDSG